MDLELLNIAIALSEQEHPAPLQDLCVITQEPHDFDYYLNDGERVCWNCGLIDSKPKLSTLPCYESAGQAYTLRSKSKYSSKAYLKKCIDLHEEQNNCSIPYEVYEDFRRFRIAFLQRFPDEPKISTRYILYRIAKRYNHPCPESTFIKIKSNRTKERYESIYGQVFKY